MILLAEGAILMLKVKNKILITFFLLPLTSCKTHSGVNSDVNVTIGQPIDEHQAAPVVRMGGDCNATFVTSNIALTTAECVSKVQGIQSGQWLGQQPVSKIAHPDWDRRTSIHPYNIGVLIFSSNAQREFYTLGTNRRAYGVGFMLVGHGCADPVRPDITGIKRWGRNTTLPPDVNAPGLLRAKGLNTDSIHGSQDTVGRSLGCVGDSGAAAVDGEKYLIGMWVGNKKIPSVVTEEMGYFIDLTNPAIKQFIVDSMNSPSSRGPEIPWPKNPEKIRAE